MELVRPAPRARSRWPHAAPPGGQVQELCDTDLLLSRANRTLDVAIKERDDGARRPAVAAAHGP